MPIYLLTLHTYRSWTEDNPRGYVQRGKPGIQPPQPKLAQHRASIASHPPVRFSCEQMHLAIEVAREVCETLGVLPIAASCTTTHVHVLVTLAPSTALTGRCSKCKAAPSGAPFRAPSRKGGADPSESRSNSPTNPKPLAARIKSIVGLRLSQQLGTIGNRWFSRGEDIKAVTDQSHLGYLITTYLPHHELIEGGVFRQWNAIEL